MERRSVIPDAEYGFRETPTSRIVWTTEDAARHICRERNYVLYVREVSRPRVARQRA
jgi:hypothetical protein